MEPNEQGQQNHEQAQQPTTPAPQAEQNSGQNNDHKAEEKTQLDELEGFFDTYLRIKAPFQLPAGLKEWIVKYGPWISLVFLILGAIILIPLLIIAFGLTAISLPIAAATGSVHTSIFGWIGIAISLAVMVMQGIAIPGLLKRQLSGWKLLYYAQLLSVASSIVNGNILSAILSLVIGMYILFQIRSYYK